MGVVHFVTTQINTKTVCKILYRLRNIGKVKIDKETKEGEKIERREKANASVIQFYTAANILTYEAL